MNLKHILALSLIVNLALAGAFAWSYGKRKGATAPDAVAAAAAVSAPAAKPEKSETPETVAPAATEPAKPAQAFDWRMVESADYKKYIANLRSIGCPEETIRDIIIADVNKLFESRKRAIRGASTNKFQFW